jgi:antitoxin HicB
MAKSYTASDGKLVRTLTPAEEGGFVVTSPLEPDLVTEAETLEEAFRMAHDAVRGLRDRARNFCAGWPHRAAVLREPARLRASLAPERLFLHHHGGHHDIWVNPATGAAGFSSPASDPQARNGPRDLPAAGCPLPLLIARSLPVQPRAGLG